MAKGYIIEEVRVTGGSMRLRDALTGETVDVAITPGAAFKPPKPSERRDAGVSVSATAPDSPPKTEGKREAGARVTDKPSAAKEAASESSERTGKQAENTEEASESGARIAEKRPRKKRAKKKIATRAADDAGTTDKNTAAPTGVAADAIDKGPMVTEESRTIVIDESTLTNDDKAALRSLRTMLASSKRRGKRGGLGWQEITVDGRSGLMARWGKGQFKILHAGDDTYALFYEWDGGKWERIGCGSAADLMHVAAKRAEEEIPRPPLTTLTLELARLYCGTPAQQETARQRLGPVFQEKRLPPIPQIDFPEDLTGLKITRVKPPKSAERVEPAEPKEPADDDEVDPALDDKIAGSFKKVLEDFE